MSIPLRNLFIGGLIIIAFYSCKKDQVTTNSSYLLFTDLDSISFDTVFTSAGSVTQQFKIFNTNDQSIDIGSISLKGGTSSPFKINVDGIAGTIIRNVRVFAKDSIYIFVSVSIDPSSSQLPFFVQDSLQINYNGNTKYVKLNAYGQNAHYFHNRHISQNETWNNDLPYVITGGLVIDTSTTLTINQGCKIYIHADAPFIINGSLVVNGDKYDSTHVVFAGDRLDEPYKNFPASYPGLFFSSSSKSNSINYTIIKNAYQGIVCSDLNSGNLSMNQVVIDNAYDAGILCLNSNVSAVNALISNCGKNIILANGGTYNFIHCTSASYSDQFLQHKFPVLYISDNNGQTSTNNLNASFKNCIFWGEDNGFVDNEVVIDKKGNGIFNCEFDHNLWRLKKSLLNCSIISALNQNPLFDSVNVYNRYFNFRLKPLSPAIDAGIEAGILIDLDGNNRPVGMPDLGCYEKH
jgi:hypothetical protein